jgi:arylsulfatase
MSASGSGSSPPQPAIASTPITAAAPRVCRQRDLQRERGGIDFSVSAAAGVRVYASAIHGPAQGDEWLLRRILASPQTYFVLAGLLLVVLLVTQFELRQPPRPRGSVEDIAKRATRDDVNVVFVLIDMLRADRLHSYGYERETSPVMDSLAATGIRFSRVIAQSSWTKTSMASLWTATWPRRNGVLRYRHALPDAAKLPAEILRDAGFRTAGLWRNGWVAPNFGFEQGFDTYVKPVPTPNPELFQRRTPSAYALLGSDEDLTRSSQEFLRSFGDQRFFLYLHYMDVHQFTYDQPSALFGLSHSDSYDNAIHWVDRNIGVLVQELADRDLSKKTILVIASDHGEAFREHGVEGHARTLHRELTNVPWIVALPFELEPGIVVEPTVGNVDLWPTLLALLGMPALDGADGQNLVPLIAASATGEPAAESAPYFAQLDRHWGRPSRAPSPFVASVVGPYRFIDAIREEGTTPARDVSTELFDRRTDPLEHHDLLALGEGSVPTDVQDALEAYLARQDPPWAVPTPEVRLDEMELNQLRALGYVLE